MTETIITINNVALSEVLEPISFILLVFAVTIAIYFVIKLLFEMITDLIKDEKKAKKLKQFGFKNEKEIQEKYSGLLRGEKFDKAKDLRNKFQEYWYY